MVTDTESRDLELGADGNKSAFIIAYAAVTFSGFLVGLLTGWAFWH